jgi:DNA-directed RNA polymerase
MSVQKEKSYINEYTTLSLSRLNELIDIQFNLENKYKTEGLERARREIQKALDSERASELVGVSKFILGIYNDLSEEIDKVKACKVIGIGGAYRNYIRRVSTDVLSVLTLNYLMNILAGINTTLRSYKKSAQSVISGLGKLVQTEILALECHAKAPMYMRRVREYLRERNTHNTRHISSTLRASAKHLRLDSEVWSNTKCMQVGKLLLTCVWNLGLFEWKKSPGGVTIMVPAKELEDIFTDVITHAATMVIRPPMIIPPVDHINIYNGGYLTALSCKDTYKHKYLSRDQIKKVNVAFQNSSQLLEALNKLQNVAYRINVPVLDFVNEARAKHINIGMPRLDPAPKPEFNFDTFDKKNASPEQLEALQEWKSKKKLWHFNDIRRTSRLRNLAMTFTLCTDFKEYTHLYFPTCVDWRYRIYFKSHLHPQGNDLQKALLEFAEAKPLGKWGLFWLEVHIANCYGFNKKSLIKRSEWTKERSGWILEFYKTPFNFRDDWEKADSPWMFLAACIEYANALNCGNPETYPSHCIISMDATCSGGQHFSALLRDNVGGRLCNLSSSGLDEKSDLYQEICNRTMDKVNLDIYNSDPLISRYAQYWRTNPVTRDICKEPGLSYFYNATQFSSVDYIISAADALGYVGDNNISLFKYCNYLGKHMRTAIGESLPSAKVCMQFLKDICKQVPKTNSIEWITPVGGLVINHYSDEKRAKIYINSMGLLYMTGYNKDGNINKIRKATTAISPNFIQSMEGAHLVKTVISFKGDIVPIHDSFGTHACDVTELHCVLREQFVSLYEDNDMLHKMLDAAKIAGADISKIILPPMGTLYLKDVLDSEFFFN